MSFKQVVHFTNDAAGLERILRFLQSVSQIIAAYATVEDAKVWWFLRRQFALGRRYFRFFKFLDCFSRAFECFYAAPGVMGLLETGKLSCMGAYLFLESLTIVGMLKSFLLPVLIEKRLDTMGVWSSTWAELCTLEGNKFWFYSLMCSILLHGLQLYAEDAEANVGPGDKAKGKKQSVQARKKYLGGIKRRMVADSFDLFIPGFVTGWIVTSNSFVGLAGVISTVVSSKDIWDNLQK